MGPLDFVQRVARLFRSNPLQCIVAAIAAGVLTCGLIHGLAIDAYSNGRSDSLILPYVGLSFCACSMMLVVARSVVDQEEDLLGKRSTRFLAELAVAVAIVLILVALLAGIVMSAIWSGYAPSAVTALGVQSVLAVVMAGLLYLSDGLHSRSRNRPR